MLTIRNVLIPLLAANGSVTARSRTPQSARSKSTGPSRVSGVPTITIACAAPARTVVAVSTSASPSRLAPDTTHQSQIGIIRIENGPDRPESATKATWLARANRPAGGAVAAINGMADAMIH